MFAKFNFSKYQEYWPMAAAAAYVILFKLCEDYLDPPSHRAERQANVVDHFLGPTEIVTDNGTEWIVSGDHVDALAETITLEKTIPSMQELAKRLNGNRFIDFEGTVKQKGSQVPNAIIQGSWSRNYVSATNPLDWIPNVNTMCEQYNRTNQTLKYGQCWIFTAFVVALCRAKGIHSRAVFSKNVSVDADNDGDFENHKGSSDFVWTFHVWAEVYFDDQWHAFDACPRQVWADKDIFCAGPVPLAEVRDAKPAAHTDALTVIPYTKDTADARYFATCAMSPDFQAFIHDQGKKINITSNYKGLPKMFA